MKMICPECGVESDGKFCPECGARTIPAEEKAPTGVNVGDRNNIMGGIHSSTADSHNIHNESHIINNVTNIAAEKSEMEILQEKKTKYLAECKRAYEDNVLEPAEKVALEECRLKLGLDEVTAKKILDEVRLLADQRNRKTSLNPIAKTKLKILSDNLQNNNIPALLAQIDNLEAIVNKFEHDELYRKYFLTVAALNPKKCIELKENSEIDNYWKSYWSYLAYIKEGKHGIAQDIILGLDRFADFPEDNITILAIAGALIAGNEDEARAYLNDVTCDYTPELQRFVDSIYIILDPEVAQGMNADEDTCAFYLVNLFGQKDPKEKEAERIAREDAERKAREDAERKAKEDAERKAKDEAERIAKEKASRKAKEEAEKKAKEDAERKAKEDYDKRQAPYNVYIDKVSDMILAMMTARNIFGWSSADFRKNSSSLPMLAVSVKGRDKAEETTTKLNKGGFLSHNEAVDNDSYDSHHVESSIVVEPDTSKYKGGISRCETPNNEISIPVEYIDLGLSVKWATCNLGATEPEGYGDYYAWGEIAAKKEGDYSKYSFNKSPITLPLENDAAHMKYGGKWRMPTDAEFVELKEKCKWKWTKLNDVKGYKVTGPNGNNIFVPAAGCLVSGINLGSGSGRYWSSSLVSSNSEEAQALDFRASEVSIVGCLRYGCHSVRPVMK